MARRSAEDYLAAGLLLLGESGSGGLTIAALSGRLTVTKGSFYHHFGSMAGYHTGLLEYWEREHSEQLIASLADIDDERQRITALTDIAISLPHATEAAIRAWGRSEPEVAAVQARVDSARTLRIRDAIIDLGIDEHRALVLAQLAISVLVGFQHLNTTADLRRMREMFEELNQLIYVEAERAQANEA